MLHLTLEFTPHYTFIEFRQLIYDNLPNRAILIRFTAFQSNQSFLYLRYSF